VPAEPGLIAISAMIGAALGSFLNVCIYRLPQNKSVVTPRSACPNCDAPIAWYDNVPIFSWLLLGGRCRHCRTGISMQYVAVEVVVAAIWGGALWRYGLSWEALTAAVFLTLLLGIAVTDAKHYIIPDEFTWGGLGAGLALSLRHGTPGVLQALIGAAVGFGLLYGVAWAGEKIFRKEAMGGGDIKMMAMVGAFVGWKGVLLTVFGGALLCTLVFVPISMRILAAGAALSFLMGDPIYEWYGRYLQGG